MLTVLLSLGLLTTTIYYPSEAFSRSSGRSGNDAVMVIVAVTALAIMIIVGWFHYCAMQAVQNEKQAREERMKENADSGMKYCPSCGAKLRDKACFCVQCGRSLQDENEEGLK